MLKISQVNQVVETAAATALKRVGVRRVVSAPTTDSDGHEALSVTVVLNSGDGVQATGEEALDAIVRIGQDLRDAGEDRQPIIEFATEEELALSDDPES
jgi:hypothetical protein